MLTIAQQKHVEELGRRLWAESGRPSADHERVLVASLAGVQRDAGEIEHLQHVGVAQLRLKRNAQHVELAHGPEALQCVERQAHLPHEPGHVRPRAIGALCEDVFSRVEDGVKDLQSRVRHADLVHVGKRQREREPNLFRILVHRVQLAADVPAGLLHVRQDTVNECVVDVHWKDSAASTRSRRMPTLATSPSPIKDESSDEPP